MILTKANNTMRISTFKLTRYVCLLFVLSVPGVANANELMAVDTAFNAMAQEKGIAEAFDYYLAENAFNLNGGYDGVPRSQVVADYVRRRDTLRMNWWPVASQLAASGDFGYTWGRFVEHTTNSDGDIEVIHGKYVTVWQKNSQGEWKSLIDIGTLNSAPPENH